MTSPAGTVVVVDDEEGIRDYLRDVLSLDGYECKCFQESLTALAYLSDAESRPDLVMTDIRMPGMDGLEFLKNVQTISPGLPVVLVSGVYELGIALQAVKNGAADYLFKPAKPAEVLSMAARHVRPKLGPEQASVQTALRSFLEHSQQDSDVPAGSNGQVDSAVQLFESLGAKRYETMQHSMRVAAYSVLFGKAWGMKEDELRDLRLGALLHDIGKIAIPRNVLLKPGPLNDKEWEVMRTHPRIGYQLLTALPNMDEPAKLVYAHHEHFDGKGYPRRLRGEGIPLGARLFSIVDSLDAITCNRSYRPARSFDEAVEEIRRCAGTQFDPALVDVFLQLPQETLATIRNQYPD